MSDVPDYSIPEENLPEGFAESIDDIPRVPATPRPAATIVILREHDDGPQVLLMRRSRSSGFVPGAYVFPGGRVDPTEVTDGLLSRIDALTPESAADRLGLSAADDASLALPLAYYIAALREAFEETGLLVAQRHGDGSRPSSAASRPEIDTLRRAVMNDEVSFEGVLEQLDTRIRGDEIAYLAHWITPLQEPRRYDARFFLTGTPAGSEAIVDRREMIDARWLRPQEALEQNRQGLLPMVFPTIHTLELLTDFASVEQALSAGRNRKVPCILPRLVRTSTGVGIEVPDEVGG